MLDELQNAQRLSSRQCPPVCDIFSDGQTQKFGWLSRVHLGCPNAYSLQKWPGKFSRKMGFALFPALTISAWVRNPRRKSSFFILFCCTSVASHSLKVQSLANKLGKVAGEKMNPSEKQNDGSSLGGGSDIFIFWDSIILLPKAEGTCMILITMEDLFHSFLLKYPQVTFCHWDSSNLGRRKFPEDYSFLAILGSLLFFPSMPDAGHDV